MNAGDTFRRGTYSHLWVIVSDPAADPEHVLMVNLTTVRRGHDPACLLDVGDHPFIRHPSWMNYADSLIETNRELEARVSSGQIHPGEPVSQAILRRIRDGAAQTDRIPIRHRQILEDQGLIDPQETGRS